MKAYAAVTDKNWFDHLRSLSLREQVDEVNFWTPKPWRGQFGVPALDAAHIRPFSEVPENYVQNGMLLRSDVHRLFDASYVTVTPDYHFEVSKHIHTDFDDGENYYKPARQGAMGACALRPSAGTGVPGVAQRESVPGVKRWSCPFCHSLPG